MSRSRIHVPIHLRWGDLDAFNHVNNATMLKLLEEARVRVFWSPVAGEDAPDTAVLETGLDAGELTLIAHQEIEYLAPVPYRREPLDVQMWFSKLGGSSVEVCYEVFSPTSDEAQKLYARASSSVVLVDAQSFRPIRLSDRMRAAWQPYLGEAVEFRRH
ncbi:MAG: 4-hydroxybenzoyl-CoA thioesterase [Microbacterium sp. SCN 70-200]|uniref:acyl-CoA thioesterase n=1 Tax=unclassified Microbacterium TaxID=2609290 RepID=UPI00086F4260|nr:MULTISPECIES: thioesterase family protein [unclassified Microbacterium]MBN9214557.1 acyl-CoA thioesterase [Microbacterium sp.]ODT41450.1 MAG: 4-hydroxybenzoyl-CoA thioesterase [Microbacterium sp. SCN 70-200]OJV84070.1 MAG: 4-hydroxybenzoyl-CoA thioesterase [Microbacterium sp. 70-16]